MGLPSRAQGAAGPSSPTSPGHRLARQRRGAPRPPPRASTRARATDLLELLAGERGLGPAPVAVRVRELPGRGRGLVSAWDIGEDETILSLPLGSCIVGPPERDPAGHWAVPLALRLLDALRADAGMRVSWLPCLPPLGFAVPLVSGAPGAWSEDVAAESRLLRGGLADALGDAGRRAEVEGAARVVGGAMARLGWRGEGGAPTAPEVLEWACSLAVSRSFLAPVYGSGADGYAHVCPPGLDLCNHAGPGAANAYVSLTHGVDSCQGARATAEVCPGGAGPGAGAGRFEGSVLELVAGPGGVAEGEEVTFSYGAAWADDVFLACYGFVPE